MNEQTIERVAKHMAAFNGDPDAWGAYASQAMDVIELAEDQWEPIETAPKDGEGVLLFDGLETVSGGWRDLLGHGAWLADYDQEFEWSGKPTKWMPTPKPPKN